MDAPAPKIISGGQTGADRAALDWAIERGLSHGGWCPKGRRAEDGRIDERYQLAETPSEDYVQRTEWNVRDSDGTVVLSINEKLTGGSEETVQLARRLKKPFLQVSRAVGAASGGLSLRGFVDDHKIRFLNVAGPRASTEPEVGQFVRDVLEEAWPRQ